MFIEVVTPARDLIVDLADAKLYCRVEDDHEDSLIEDMIATAVEVLDGPDGYLQRSLGEQVIRITLQGFPASPFSLPLPPIRTIDSITYVAAGGVVTALDPANYLLNAGGQLELAFGANWPDLRDPDAPVVITCAAGYEDLPKVIRMAILLMVVDLYDNRPAAAVSPDVRSAAERLVQRLVFTRV